VIRVIGEKNDGGKNGGKDRLHDLPETAEKAAGQKINWNIKIESSLWKTFNCSFEQSTNA
jgi:hypothetical protein